MIKRSTMGLNPATELVQFIFNPRPLPAMTGRPKDPAGGVAEVGVDSASERWLLAIPLAIY